jgi:transcriptional repressor NrdR
MRCPKCGSLEDRVIDSRLTREGQAIRRRRECCGCGYRYTTYEKIEREGLRVIKRDGRREDFSREKLIAGIQKACQKRPISQDVIESMVDRIITRLADKYDREVPSTEIGKLVMDELRKLDEVAYVRFASVYRRFEEATDFVQEVKKLGARR